MAHSEKTFEHWNEWAQMYRTALDNPDDAVVSAQLLGRMIPAQKDIFATLWPSFAGEDVKPRSVRHTSWCSAELIRLAARKVDNAVGVRLLQQADVLAKEQDALAWQLRIAISLAERHLEREERAKARAVSGASLRDLQPGLHYEGSESRRPNPQVSLKVYSTSERWRAISQSSQDFTLFFSEIVFET